MSSALAVTTQDFDEEVLQSEVPVLVDFWAEWCRPCKAIAPMVDALADEYAEKIKVMKVDTEKEASLAAKYGVMSIPTLILFKSGEVVEQMVGVMPKQKIIEKVLPHLAQ